jgi:ABC-type multidrug transport system fused ATPase/permease subunit
VFFGGFFFGLSQFLFFLVFGIVFLSGAGFIDLKLFVPNDSKNDLLTKILACVFATIFCSTPLGYYGQFMPDISAGKTSALRIFKLLDLPL